MWRRTRSPRHRRCYSAGFGNQIVKLPATRGQALPRRHCAVNGRDGDQGEGWLTISLRERTIIDVPPCENVQALAPLHHQGE